MNDGMKRSARTGVQAGAAGTIVLFLHLFLWPQWTADQTIAATAALALLLSVAQNAAEHWGMPALLK